MPESDDIQTAATVVAALSTGMRMRDLFDTAKIASALPLSEVELLLTHPTYEARLSGCCILDFRARARRTSDDERHQLYVTYLTHHDTIDTWDMVDRAAPSVIGGYLLNRPKVTLHELATATDPIRRRTAITAPLWFIRFGSIEGLADVFPIAARLATDPNPIVHKAVGIALKHAGGRDPDAVVCFLDDHADAMPRPAVRLAVEKLTSAQRSRFIHRPTP